MLAEAFDKEVQAFCQSTEFVPELPFKLDLFGLYERFINKMYDICLEEKFKIPKTNVGAEVARKKWVKTNTQNHQILALKMLFTEEQLNLLHINSQCTSLDEELTRAGIMQHSYKRKLHFIHRTFAEFYVADYFVKELTNESTISQEIQDFLLQKIFLEKEYRVIRVFIDGQLSRSEPSNEVTKQYGNRIHDLGKDGVLTLHTTAGEGNANIIGFLLETLEKTGHAVTLVMLLSAHDHDRHTAWGVAAEKGQLRALHTLWDWANKITTSGELNKKMFLAKDIRGRTAWHMAARTGQLEVLHKLWEWAKEVLTPEELKNELFLDKDEKERSAWHMAAEMGRIEILKKLWDCAKEVLTTEELQNMSFLARDIYGLTAWHVSTLWGRVGVLNKLWEWAKELLTPGELNSMFLDKDMHERSAWHIAAEECQIEVLHKLWEWAKEVLTLEELKKMSIVLSQRYKWIDCLPFVSVVGPNRGITQTVRVGKRGWSI